MSADATSPSLQARSVIWVTPAFVATLIIFGGASREAFIPNGILQVVSALLIAWRLSDDSYRLTRLGSAVAAIAGAFICVGLVQLIPLPPEVWTRLPGRSIVTDGFAAVGESLPWLPLSMTPESTFYGLLKFLPPLAAFLLVAATPPSAMTHVVSWTLLLAAAATTSMGVAQVVGGRDSELYFYAFTNWGQPVGFMANVNHQATLLLMTLPFCGVLISRLSVNAELGDRTIGMGIILVGLSLVVVLGVIISGSVAGYGLLLPALVLAVLTGRGRDWNLLTGLILLGLGLSVAALGLLAVSSPLLTGLGVTDFSSASLSRPDTYQRTLAAIADTFPAGSGLGSFKEFFPAYEDPDKVTQTFMNNAHNDYLEFVLEFGVAGVIVLAAILAWATVRGIAIWRSENGDGARLRRAASAALLIVALHSIVDYPLRTGAIAGIAAMCLGIMAGPSARTSRRRPALEAPAGSHVTL